MPKDILSGPSIWDVLKQPHPKTVLRSAGPGTGPYQADTVTSKRPQNVGGPLIPKTVSPDAVGYGGAPDTVTYAKYSDSYKEHADFLDSMQARMPTLAHGGPPKPTLPRFNQIYDSFRTDRAWMYSNDFSINGTITPSTAGNISNAIAIPANQGLIGNRLSQFPGGINFYLMVRTYGFGASALTMTGSLYVYFQDWNNQVCPLGILTGTQYNSDLTNINTIMTTPITDAGFTTLGSINATMTNGGTPVACTWFLTFAFAYLLPDPAYNGYAVDTIPPLQKKYRELVEASHRQ